MDKKELKKKYKYDKKNIRCSYREMRNDARQSYLSGLVDIRLNQGRKIPVNPPWRPGLEEIGNAVTHGVGSLLSVLALVLMCLAANTRVEYLGAVICFVGQMLMFTISCLYHSFRHGSAVKRLFRRFDYSSIYFMIGGTFAPILLCYSRSPLAIWFFFIQWALIVTGVTFIGVYGPTRLNWLHFPLYLLLGWCGIMFIPEMLTRGDYLLFSLILGGGVLYSLGVVPFTMKKRVAHFIWHFFVLAGAIVQWFGIYLVIYLG